MWKDGPRVRKEAPNFGARNWLVRAHRGLGIVGLLEDPPTGGDGILSGEFTFPLYRHRRILITLLKNKEKYVLA
jgi:hypothetical protein